jgi:hypothetical protein
MENSVAISLVSVAVGWFLAQGTDILKIFWNSRKYRKGLLLELQDIHDQLRRVIMIHSRQIQIFSIDGLEPTAALPVENMFYRQHFKDAFSNLNAHQRISYQLIHASLENLNKQNEELANFSREAYKELCFSTDENKKNSIIKLWGDRVITLYKSAREIQWLIGFHLCNSNSPVYDIMGEMHKSYLKFDDKLNDEIRNISQSAKGLKKEDFKRIYDEYAFDHQSGNND